MPLKKTTKDIFEDYDKGKITEENLTYFVFGFSECFGPIDKITKKLSDKVKANTAGIKDLNNFLKAHCKILRNHLSVFEEFNNRQITKKYDC